MVKDRGIYEGVAKSEEENGLKDFICSEFASIGGRGPDM